jgi:uncharacterized protein with NRDE domain
MCLLALFYRAAADAPVVVGANREELYARGGEPPRILEGTPRVIAGVDPQAGGTWLGVNEAHLLVAVTNRPKTVSPLDPRSRGLLARELLHCSSAVAASALAARELGSNHYAGCNVLCVDPDNAMVVHGADWLRIRTLPPGLHVLTARDVNDDTDQRLAYAKSWLSQRSYGPATECIEALKRLCAQSTGDHPAICLRGDKGGTVSSSIVALRATWHRSTYLHAQGPPDQTRYDDYSALLRQIAPVHPIRR